MSNYTINSGIFSRIEQIARTYKLCDTLEVRNNDSLDFHDCAVWNIRDALHAAYEAGRKANLDPETAKRLRILEETPEPPKGAHSKALDMLATERRVAAENFGAARSTL